MSILSADEITQAEHYTKQTQVKWWLILMLYPYIISCVPPVQKVFMTGTCQAGLDFPDEIYIKIMQHQPKIICSLGIYDLP